MYCSDLCASSPSFLSVLFIMRVRRGRYTCSSWCVRRYASFSSGVTDEWAGLPTLVAGEAGRRGVGGGAGDGTGCD